MSIEFLRGVYGRRKTRSAIFSVPAYRSTREEIDEHQRKVAAFHREQSRLTGKTKGRAP